MRAAIVTLWVLTAAPAFAHHEAIFGPQSSMVLSAPTFVSLQVFHQAPQAGEGETTMLLSTGIAPSHHSNASFALILPVSVGHHGAGVENIVAGGRYKLDLRGLQERTGKDGNFVLFMGAMEIPNGNVERPAFSGAVNWMTAALVSFEWSVLSFIGYAFYRLDRDGDGDQLFTGLGVAYTPYEKRGRLISLQGGVSHETTFAGRDHGLGWQLMFNPTVMGQLSPRWQLFLTASVPMAARGLTAEDADRWRIGAGVLYLIGGHQH